MQHQFGCQQQQATPSTATTMRVEDWKNGDSFI